MKLLKMALVAAVFVLALWCGGASAQDLTGVWRASDGGTYYIRQLGGDVWWLGDGDGSFANVAYGRIDGNLIRLNWADVPRGGTRGDGELVLIMENPHRLVARRATGGFAARVWTRQ